MSRSIFSPSVVTGGRRDITSLSLTAPRSSSTQSSLSIATPIASRNSSSQSQLLSINTPPMRRHPSLDPTFRKKEVHQLICLHCETEICERGMKAILLANQKVELYSTDTPPSLVELVGRDYATQNCMCKIRDVACLGCGNIVGYHVTQPCERCLSSCNNGHLFMFLSNDVSAKQRLMGSQNLLWMHLEQGLEAKHEEIAVAR